MYWSSNRNLLLPALRDVLEKTGLKRGRWPRGFPKTLSSKRRRGSAGDGPGLTAKPALGIGQVTRYFPVTVSVDLSNGLSNQPIFK